MVTFNDSNKTKVVKFDKVTTFIQGGGAVYHSIWDDLQKYMIRSSYIGLIDPGEKTTNYLAFFVSQNGKMTFESELSGTIDIGMSRIKVSMDKLYTQKTGKKLDIAELISLTREGKIYYQGEYLDFKADLDLVKTEIARAIKNASRKNIANEWAQ
jgi:plasmid segregation protein ParM